MRVNHHVSPPSMANAWRDTLFGNLSNEYPSGRRDDLYWIVFGWIAKCSFGRGISGVDIQKTGGIDHVRYW